MTQTLSELVLGVVGPDSLQPYSPKGGGNQLDNLSGDVLEDVMEAMYCRGESWSDSWRVFLTPRIRTLIVPWDLKLLKEIGNTCRSLEVLLVVSQDVPFTAVCLQYLPGKLHTLDFDGQLYFAGRALPEASPKRAAWLEDVDFWIRSLRTERLTPLPSNHNVRGLSRLHLGRATVTSDEIVEILQLCPGLTFLRHYQLVKALCQLHMEKWKSGGGKLPAYKLTNIDADFSHVVRCRMSPKAVLPVDSLGLAVALCPSATSVRIRFDNSTSHHVVSHLLELSRLEDFSAVCVSSGERVLLDFQDFLPLLGHFGPTCLKHLELKVVEEVDPHVILKQCGKLEGLTLSGCGFAQTCRGPRCRPAPALQSLVCLFYADGDDFSWDHTLPQCFWIGAFGSGKKRDLKLEGLFLESPRISEDTLDMLLTGDGAEFKRLRSACVKRSPEFSKDRLEQLVAASPALRYLRCEGLGPAAAGSLTRLRAGLKLKLDQGCHA